MISNEEKLSAVIDALKAKGGWSKFTEQSKNITGVEPKLNCALAVLKEATGICQLTNESGQWDLGFPKKEEITESTGYPAGYVFKNNGDGRMFAYESANNDPYAATDKMILESVCAGLEDHPVKVQGGTMMSKAQAKEATRKALNLPDELPEGLNEGQREEYRFSRSIGISEADALRLVKITGGYGSGHSKGAYGRMMERHSPPRQ
jgi:hypothetical protein